MTTNPLVIWEGADGRTHAAVSRFHWTLCRSDTEPMTARAGNPLTDSVNCPACAARIVAAMADLTQLINDSWEAKP